MSSLREPFERIVCLTEEPTEILYLLGESSRIVGISAYTVRPQRARAEHPVVSAFIDGSLPKITALRPDLVIGFSDIQSKLAGELIAAGLQVLIFNQRSLAEIMANIIAIGRLVGAEARAHALVDDYEARLGAAREAAGRAPRRPRVYFEEWDEPTICGIRWVSELIEVAGGEDVFSTRARGGLAVDRIVTSQQVFDAAPEVVIASWCGKPFDLAAFTARADFARLPAVVAGQVHELDPSIILQPGPACLTDGLAEIARIIALAAAAPDTRGD